MHVFISCQTGTKNTTYSHSGTNNTHYEDPQGPGTMLLKSGTVPEIRDVEAYVPGSPTPRLVNCLSSASLLPQYLELLLPAQFSDSLQTWQGEESLVVMQPLLQPSAISCIIVGHLSSVPPTPSSLWAYTRCRQPATTAVIIHRIKKNESILTLTQA